VAHIPALIMGVCFPNFSGDSHTGVSRLIASTKGNGQMLSEEERTIRDAEAGLLAKISCPPRVGDDALQKLVNSRNAIYDDNPEKE
jgi:hypothetical protein